MNDYLTEEQGAAIRAARRALGETLSALVPVDEALRLAMVAYAGGFADMLMAGAHSGGAGGADRDCQRSVGTVRLSAGTARAQLARECAL